MMARKLNTPIIKTRLLPRVHLSKITDNNTPKALTVSSGSKEFCKMLRVLDQMSLVGFVTAVTFDLGLGID